MTVNNAIRKENLPLWGVLLSLVLFVLSAARYPGGYDWTHHFVSMLIRPIGVNQAANPSRPLGIVAMFTLSISMGILFKSVSMTMGIYAKKRRKDLCRMEYN